VRQISQAVVDNPTEFATVAVRIIKEKLTDQLVEGIQYQKINEWYEMAYSPSRSRAGRTT